MNITSINHNSQRLPAEAKALFAKMEYSLKSANANFEKSVRIAKTLAPLLNDQSSNERHLGTIASSASVQEKVIAILMLGFPKNRPMLPTLQEILLTGSEAMQMASAIAITQMRDGENNDILSDILMTGYHNARSADVKKAIRQAILAMIDSKTARLVKEFLSDEK